MQPKQSMEEIYRSYAMTVYKYLLSMTHDEGLSEELTQETFCQAIRSASIRLTRRSARSESVTGSTGPAEGPFLQRHPRCSARDTTTSVTRPQTERCSMHSR